MEILILAAKILMAHIWALIFIPLGVMMAIASFGLQTMAAHGYDQASDRSTPSSFHLTAAYQSGSDPANIGDAQWRLLELGYDVGEIDAAWGLQTERAVTRFRRDRGLESRGPLDVATIQALDNEVISLLPADVRSTLNDRFSEWHFYFDSDGCAPTFTRGMITGDFNRDGVRDFVIRIYQGDHGIISAFLSDGALYREFVLESGSYSQIRNNGINIVLRGTIVPELIEYTRTGRQISVQTDTLVGGVCESPWFLLYLRYHRISEIRKPDLRFSCPIITLFKS